MALRAIPENYPVKTQQQTAVYREVFLRKDQLVNLNEAVVDLETTGYDTRHRHRKAWSAAWDNNVFRPYRLKGRQEFLGVHFPEGTQQYAALNDRWRVLYSRISLGAEPDNCLTHTSGGALSLVGLDKVRLGYDYLSSKGMKDYDYELVDTVLMNGAFCYHLTFKPDDDKQTKYFALPKTQPTGVFKGDLYLALDDLAIVGFAAENAKDIITNYGRRARRLPAGTVQAKVNYTRSQQGRWRMADVVSTVRSPVNPAITLKRSLYLTGGRIPTFATGKRSFWAKNDHSTNLYSVTKEYDSDFWEAFSETSLYGNARKLTGDKAWPEETVSTYFSAPFSFDTISLPVAVASKTLKYINSKKIVDKYAWIADPADSATTNYLDWENDFYEQFFRWNADAVDRVHEQYSRPAQGLPSMEERAPSIDTLLRRVNGVLGFYRNDLAGKDELLQPLDSLPLGYRLTDYEWSKDGRYYSLMLENRRYDKIIRIYNATGKLTERAQVDDYLRRGDTIFVTTNNAELRTEGFARWTPQGGWVELLQEENPTFEFRMVNAPSGELILLSESLNTAKVFSQRAGTWQAEAETMPALLGGTGMRGRGCKEEGIEADYLSDCRSTQLGTCVIALKSGRMQIWLKPTGAPDWKQIPLPGDATLVSFGRTEEGTLSLETEGPGSYGQSYRPNFSTLELDPITTDFAPIYLPEFQDSIVWVTASDGTKISCQLRWRTDQRDKLRGTIMKVYAAYGNPYIAGQNSEDVALMNLGHAIVYVHARGGGTQGPEWQEAGRAANKPVAIADYLTAVRHFYDRHPLRTTPICGYGQSAGGTILGAAVNQAPKLFHAAIFDHAYLDVVNTMSRPELPLTRYEYTEWGNPEDKKIRQIQRSYSPYQNIRAQVYPAMLFLAGHYDQSTPYWQIAKFVAAVRNVNQDSAPVLLHTAPLGSHPGTPFGPGPLRSREAIAFWEVVVGKE